MVIRVASITALGTTLLLGACSPAPRPPATKQGDELAAPDAVASPDDLAPTIDEVELDGPAEPLAVTAPPTDPIPVEVTDQQRRVRAKRMFGEVMESLSEASEAYDAHDQLDESSWFTHDQEDNIEHINKILDESIAVLGVSEIETTRGELRRLEADIEALEARRIADREARVSAPLAEELNQLQRAYTKSVEDYDERITDAERGIAERRDQIRDLQVEFVRQMSAIGVELDLASAQSLLSTVTGDDFVEMCVVFDNVRGVTIQLQELTEESGESLDAAKRYYGSYVVLMRLMDKIQRDFMRRVAEEMIPRLEELASDARRINEQAEENMFRGGDRSIGEQNIRANKLTIQAPLLYVEYLREQAAEIQASNDRLQISLRDAQNTYQTVTLASEVATLLREGQRNFAALLRLDLPSLRGFENEELKAEFERLTARISP